MSTQDGRRIPLFIGAGVVAVLAVGGLLLWHAESRTNKEALTDTAKRVTYTQAQAAQYRPKRLYVGTFEPWVQANVGPQLVSAYVDTVLVRPGARIKRGEILATLDCRNASASSQAVAMQARAIDARQQAIAHESARTQGMLSGGFVSPNDAERIAAQSISEQAELEATKAKLTRTTLEVDDCILRAPFDGEVANRSIDPGAFVRPGTSIVTVVDRKIVRMTGDAPESDFDVVRPGTPVTIHIYSTNKDVIGTVTRRAPAADPGTRTIDFEIDIADPQRDIPVGTTGEVHIDVGEPVTATAIPIFAAAIRGKKASVVVIEQDVAHVRTLDVVGEDGGTLFLSTELIAGAHVVVEGRALLDEGDKVVGKLLPPTAASSAAPAPAPTNVLPVTPPPPPAEMPVKSKEVTP